MPQSSLATNTLISTSRFAAFGPSFVDRVATVSGCESIELDFAVQRLRRIAPFEFISATSSRTRAIWVNQQDARIPAFLGDLREWINGEDSGESLLVVDLEDLKKTGATIQVAYRAATLLSRRDPLGRVALGIRSAPLAGGRKHLADLTLVRRQAEEWGLSIAIDLTGRFDPLWEAEAAVARLASCLALVRVNAAVTVPGPINLDRVSRRALKAALESNPQLLVSLQPSIAWWRWCSPKAIATNWHQAAQRLRRSGPNSRVDASFVAEFGRESRRIHRPQ